MINDKVHEKYLNDVTFRMIVDHLQAFLAQYEMTPMELRQAVMYACCLHEARNIQPVFYPKTSWHVMDKNDFDKENS